jgi:RNA polymerase sigma-70 factor (ECF subfamily)
LALRSALGQLSEVQRSVVVAVYFGGRSQRQVAAEYGLPVGTVHRQLFLGLRQLGSVLDESLTASASHETASAFPHECLE